MSRFKARTALNTLTKPFIFGLLIVGVMSIFGYVACNGQGDTDGGPGNDDAGIGSQPVSDGGFGATLTIRLKDGDDEIGITEREAFFVDAYDPNGQPLAFRRVFCETEKGIAILEPSKGGVAFEHTGPDGSMSGVLGGVTPGSYLIECRLEQGFNLVARKRLKIVGEVPPGFAGFPGAAGGNLGGGQIVPNPVTDPRTVTITFTGVGYSNQPNGPIDTFFDNNCDNVATTIDPEPFGFDDFNVTITNPSVDTFVITGVKFEVPTFGIESATQSVAVEIAGGVSGTFSKPFTEFVGFSSAKTFATTTSAVPDVGTYNVTFTVTGETLAGEDFSITESTSVQFGTVDRCDG